MKPTRPGWTKTNPPGEPTYRAEYAHVSGWRVLHCGHPTALWPYYLQDPQGPTVVSHTGHGFDGLEYAQQTLEAVLAGQLELVKPSPDEALRAMDPAQAKALRELRAVYPDGRLPRRRARRSA